MVFNPVTGKEEEPEFFGQEEIVQSTETPPVLASKGVVIEEPGIVGSTEVVEEIKPFEPKGMDAVVDIAEEKAGPAPVIDLTRDTFTDILSKEQKDRSKEEQTLIRKFKARRALGETTGQIFGDEAEISTPTEPGADTEADRRIADIKAKGQEAVTAKEEEVNQRLEIAKGNIQERGKQRSATLDRSLSFSGFGRSSSALEKRDSLQQSINNEIAQAEAKADLEVQLFKAQQAGAEAETISSIQNGIRNATAKLKETEAKNARDLAELNQELGLKADEALDALVNGTSQGLEAKDKGFDQEASIALGYVSDSFGNPLVTDENGDPQAFTGSDLGSDVKISNFKDGNDNTYVYKNGELSQIIQRDGTILSGEEVKTAKVPAEVKESQTTKQKLELEGTLRKQFGSDPLIKKFSDIKSNFQRVQAGVNANSAAGDIALVFSFMKMLDPGSVVREGEFATAQNATGVPEQIRNQWNKLKTGEFLDKKQKKDFEARAQDIFDNETENATSVRDFYKRIAEDSGARTEFITGAFDDLSDVTPTIKFSDEQENILNQKFKTGTTSTAGGGTDFKSPSGKTFKIPEEKDFKIADQTAGQKDIPTSSFTEKIDLARTGTNVAKDTNNPGNITADSIPAGTTKKEYGKRIGATGTYLSPNGREYFVFPNVKAGSNALKGDLTAKITGKSGVIKPNDTLARFQRVYVGQDSPNYLAVLKRITGANENTKIKDINADLLTKAVMKAEGFNG